MCVTDVVGSILTIDHVLEQVILTDEQIFSDYTIRKLEAQVSSVCVGCVHTNSCMYVVRCEMTIVTAQGRFGASIESDSVPLHCLA